MNSETPYCLLDRIRPHAEELAQKISEAIPSGSELYLMGGALRNALAYSYHGMQLPQRDYDCIFIGNQEGMLTKNLDDMGFKPGDIQKDNQRTFTIPCVDQPQSLNDFFVLDINYFHSTAIQAVLGNKANFTINGFAVSFADLVTPGWQSKLTQLETSVEDMRNKKLKVNPLQNMAFAYSNLFAAIRFMSQGFEKPDAADVSSMLNAAKNYPPDKFEKNVQKVFSYVGGEAKAKAIVTSLGVHKDVFNYDALVGSR